MSNLLHNNHTSEFYKRSYINVLDFQHLEGTQVKLDKLTLSDSGLDTDQSFWGYVFVKGEKKFLLSAYDENKKEIDLSKVLPIIPTTTRKVAHKNTAYWQILGKDKMAINPEKHYTFTELFNILSDFEHSNPKHYKMWVAIVLTQWMSRANFRLVTPSGFGKSTVIDNTSNLGFSMVIAANPNRPKLELLSQESLVYIDEINDLSKRDLSAIVTYLLSAADGKSKVAKQTRAYGSIGEMIDLSDTSFGFMFNDITNYPSPKDYLDYKVNIALLDRFAPLRLYGTFDEQFKEVNYIDPEEYVDEHIADYIKIVRTLQHYKENRMSYVHKYDAEDFLKTIDSSRHQAHFRELLITFDMLSSTKEEFDEWVKVLKSANLDYKDMMDHMSVREEFLKRVEHLKSHEDKNERKKYNTIIKNLNSTEPFKAKTEFCFQIMKGPTEQVYDRAITDNKWFEK